MLTLVAAADTALAVPRFTSTPVTAVNEDAAYVYDIRTSDTETGTRTISATQRPTWLSLTNVSTSGTARLSGTPTQAHVGTHAVTLLVTNTLRRTTATQSFTITVANVNDAPVITGQTPDPIPLARNTSLTVALSHLLVTDVDHTYPNGFTLTVLNGTNYARSGNTITPAANFSGILSVGVRVSDGASAASNTFNLRVSVAGNQPPQIAAPIPDQRAIENAPFQLTSSSGAPATLAAFFRDPDNDALTYTVTGLPPSGVLVANSTTGAITGTPRATDARDTPYIVEVTASDGRTAANQLPRQSFRLTISALDRADLSVGITVTPAPAATNAAIEWRFTIANSGPRPSASAQLTADFVGNPFTFTELTTCTVSASADGQRLTCPVPTLAVGATTAVVARGRAAAGGDVFVTATIAGITSVPGDPDASDNRAIATLNVAETLSSPLQSLASPDTRATAAGDVDGDGFADVALAKSSRQGASIYLNVVDPANVRRRRLSESATAVGETPAADLALADLDGDSDADLVMANNTGQTNQVYVNSAGTFALGASLGGGKSNAVAVVDLDRDGLRDVVFANDGPGTVYLNKGGGRFDLAAQLGSDNNRQVVAVDLDLDNLPELVFASVKGQSRYYRNLGGGRFSAGVVVDADGAESVASGDFNGDNRPDLVFARLAAASGPPSNAVYQNNAGTGGSPQLVRTASLGASPTVDVLTADVDSDGAMDVIAINSTATHQVYRGDAKGGFALHPVQLSIAGPVSAALGQFNGDTRIDLIVTASQTTGIFVNDGRGGLGRGDSTLPVIQLLGEPAVTVTVGNVYTDAGATASDDLDGNLTSSVVVENDVDATIVGSYVVTFDVTDSAGNAAPQVTRSVTVAPRDGAEGGGGGAAGDLALALGALLYLCRRRRRA